MVQYVAIWPKPELVTLPAEPSLGQADAMDGVARRMYEQAGFDCDEPASPVALADSLLGRGCVRAVHASRLSGDGAIAWVRGNWRIYVRSRLEGYALRFVVLHELSHWELGPDATEDECDALAAALLVPRRAFLAAMSECGDDLAKLAACLDVSESFAALRLGEVTGEPIALVSPERVRVRGEIWGWPDERVLREGAAGLRRIRLTDDRRRYVLTASNDNFTACEWPLR